MSTPFGGSAAAAHDSNNNNHHNSGLPPPNHNPVLTAYENFVRDTPFVTRMILTSQCLTWILSFFFPNLSLAMANIPQFTIFKLELYRLIISPLICPGFLSLLFAYLSFLETGRRMEYSMGSSPFGGMVFTLGILTNVVHVVLCFALSGILANHQTFMLLPSYGIWIILFAVIAMDCVKLHASSNQPSVRKLFFFTVPTLYYPVALFGLFAILGGFQLSYLISIGIGYAYGLGHLDKFKISHSKYQRWEETILENFTRREGWVSLQNATGSSSFAFPYGGGTTNNATTTTSSSGSGGGGGIFRDLEFGQGAQTAAAAGGGGSSSGVSFPVSGGRQLGGGGSSGSSTTAERRHGAGGGGGGGGTTTSAAEARQARLQALEQRGMTSSSGGDGDANTNKPMNNNNKD